MSDHEVRIVEASDTSYKDITVYLDDKQIAWVSTDKHGEGTVNIVYDMACAVAEALNADLEETWQHPSW